MQFSMKWTENIPNRKNSKVETNNSFCWISLKSADSAVPIDSGSELQKEFQNEFLLNRVGMLIQYQITKSGLTH